MFDGCVLQVENAFGGAVDLGAGAVSFLRRVLDAVRPGVDAAVPVVKQAASKALDLASPIVAGASKQAQDSLRTAGIDPAPALNAAKVPSFLPFFNRFLYKLGIVRFGFCGHWLTCCCW